MKTGKEIKTNKFKNYNVTFGSVNNKNPKAIYINISSWAQPKEEDELSYTSSIRGLNKKIRQNLFNTLSEDSDSLFDKNRTIVDLDIRESGIRYGKSSDMQNWIYDRQLTMFTTITGELSLLMLIEQYELNGIHVISANTDGVTIQIDMRMDRHYTSIYYCYMALL